MGKFETPIFVFPLFQVLRTCLGVILKRLKLFLACAKSLRSMFQSCKINFVGLKITFESENSNIEKLYGF